MVRRSLGFPLLTIKLTTARVGWLPVVAASLLLVALAAHFFLLPLLQEEAQAIQRSLADLQSGRATSTHAHELATRYTSFRSQLAKPEERGALLKSLFKTGTDAGITLSQAEYQWRSDAACGCLAMQMIMPIRGGYVPIRRFLENVLVSLPAVSLDEISFRRSTVKASGIEAQLRLTFYFADGS